MRMAKEPKVESKPAPVVEVSASPWGDVMEGEFQEPTRDKFYVHGYSDKRTQFDRERAETGKGKPLSYRLQYVPVETAANKPTNVKSAEYRMYGYTPLLYDECAAHGIDPALSGFVRGEDGTCRVGSQMLMIAPATAAARMAKHLDERNLEQAGAPRARMENAVENYNAWATAQGASPTKAVFEEKITTERERR
jgi:hypothetical protein